MERVLASPRRTAAALVGLVALSAGLYTFIHAAQTRLRSGALISPGAMASGWDDPASHAALVVLLAGYSAAVLGLLIAYELLVTWARDAPPGGIVRWALVGLPVLFHAAFWLTSPFASTDVLSYAAYGHIATVPGGNPYFQEGRTILGTDFGGQLVALGWPGSALSPYGPVWNAAATLAVRYTTDAASAVWLLKGVVVVATLGTAAAAAWVLAAVRPTYQLAGAVAILWNPALVLLLAGDGHNDALVMLLVVVSLGLSVRGRVGGGILVQLLAVLIKYVPLVVLPLQAAHWWHTEPNRQRLVRQAVLVGVIGLAMAVAAYAGTWIGVNTFLGTGLLGTGEPIEQRFDVSGWLVVGARYAAVATAIVVGALRARSGARLLEAAAIVVLVALQLGPQRYWPWYAALPLALLALSPGRVFRWPALVLSGCALLVSAMDVLPTGVQEALTSDSPSAVVRVARVLPLIALVAAWASSVRPFGSPTVQGSSSN